MESIINAFQSIFSRLDEITIAVLAILGGFSALAKVTPTQADDKFFQKILDFVHLFGLTKKK